LWSRTQTTHWWHHLHSHWAHMCAIVPPPVMCPRCWSPAAAFAAGTRAAAPDAAAAADHVLAATVLALHHWFPSLIRGTLAQPLREGTACVSPAGSPPGVNLGAGARRLSECGHWQVQRCSGHDMRKHSWQSLHFGWSQPSVIR